VSFCPLSLIQLSGSEEEQAGKDRKQNCLRNGRKEPLRNHCGHRMVVAAKPISFPTRPSFSTAHRKRPINLSHLRKTLKPGVPVLPFPGIFGRRWAVASVSRGSLAYRGSMQLLRCPVVESNCTSFATLMPPSQKSQLIFFQIFSKRPAQRRRDAEHNREQLGTASPSVNLSTTIATLLPFVVTALHQEQFWLVTCYLLLVTCYLWLTA
jgi:hypothetical protein